MTRTIDTIVTIVTIAFPLWFAHETRAQCLTGGPDTRQRLYSIPGGESVNTHPFDNRCLAAPGSTVTVKIEALADLGCNATDAVNNGNPPTSCGPPPLCCDTDPTLKYLTVTANTHNLNSLTASNAPSNGRFFEEWDLDSFSSPESGRSYCMGGVFALNSHTVSISASNWNSWLGANGNTMSFNVSASSAVKRLYSYCCDIGVNGCQSFCPNCAPETFSKITLTYSQCTFNDHCDDSNPCTTDSCTSGHCQYSNNSASCDDGVFCNGSDTCSGGACAIHAGDPCDPEYCNESDDQCELIIEGSEPPDGAIDARQPSNPDGSNPAGWSIITLTMSGDATGLDESDFSVTWDGENSLNIDTLTIDDADVILELESFIPVGEWTHVSYLPGNSDTCLGYLPADVSNDGTSASSDILWLVDCLNGVRTCEIWQCDADRSLVCGPPDILRVIDLLNGAGTYDPWLNVALSENPCGGAESMMGGEGSDFVESFLTLLIEGPWSDELSDSDVQSIALAMAEWVASSASASEVSDLIAVLEDSQTTFAHGALEDVTSELIRVLGG
jgi:hypothetical protein